MEGKRPTPVLPPMMMIMMVVLSFQGFISEANHSVISIRNLMDTSSIVLPLTGDFYPKGGYLTTINISKPAMPFELLIDTGSPFSWLKCEDPDIIPPEPSTVLLYKPPEGSMMQCQHPSCAAIRGKEHRCADPTGRCDYVFQYFDNSSTEGYLVRDVFQLRFMDGSIIDSPLVFGCGYKQIGNFPGDGIIGLSRNQGGFLSQIHEQGLIKKVIGHCFNGEGGGFIVMGDNLVPLIGASWTPIRDNYETHYVSEPADLLFEGSATKVQQLDFFFDSGSSLTYFNPESFRITLDRINHVLEGNPIEHAEPETSLPICWKRSNEKPIRSFNNIRHYFKDMILHFPNDELNVNLDLPLQSYLILVKGKVCLGIKDGGILGLSKDMNIIGAISMQDKLVIYDSVKRRIGWASRNCNNMAIVA